MSAPLVTISVSSYNNSKYIEETLNSIYAQTYKNLQLVIIEDCSKDNSVEIIERWLALHSSRFSEVVFIKNETNQGVCQVANQMLENASGKYISLIASDDVMINDKISEQVEIFEASPAQVALVYGDIEVIDENSKLITESMFSVIKGPDFIPPCGEIFRHVLHDFFFYMHSCLIKTGYLRGLKLKADGKVISEDWHWQLSLTRNYLAVGTKKIYAKYRKVSTSVTQQNWTVERMHKVLRSHFYLISQYLKHPLNSKRDNEIVLEKLRSIFDTLRVQTNISFKVKIIYAIKLFLLSKSLRDLSYINYLVGNSIAKIKRTLTINKALAKSKT